MALLVAAVGAEDVSAFGYKRLVGQTQGASLAVEAVFMPGAAFVGHDVHTFAKTWWRVKGLDQTTFRF